MSSILDFFMYLVCFEEEDKVIVVEIVVLVVGDESIFFLSELVWVMYLYCLFNFI